MSTIDISVQKIDGKAASGTSAPLLEESSTISPAAATEAGLNRRAMAAPDDRVLTVHVEVIYGGLTNFQSPIAVAPRYQTMPVVGATKAFDRLLDCWLTRSMDLGIIGSELGRLFPINLRRLHEEHKVNVEYLLLAGMGEPGQFGEDDLRYLTSNIIVTVKSLRQKQFSTPLIGTRRNELSIDQAVRGFLQGILDGHDRFWAIAEAVTMHREVFLEAAAEELHVAVVEPDKDKVEQILNAFQNVQDTAVDPRLDLEVHRGETVAVDAEEEPSTVDVDPDMKVTLIRVTHGEADAPPPVKDNPMFVGGQGTTTFRFSALSDVAAVTVREAELNSYLVRELPERITQADSASEQERFGLFFQNYLIPDDFCRVVDGAANLTFVVDEQTATYPWEMAAYEKYGQTKFIGTNMAVSRRFQTLLSPPPSSSPPLNGSLKVLIIADPAPGDLSLPHARDEALAVLDVLHQASHTWQGEFKFSAQVRIGSYKQSTAIQQLCEQIRDFGPWVESAQPCDPLELVVLIVNGHFDVIHYAGHGACDPRTRRAGWLFDRDCFLSASEIFRVRQVPRLVFANACFSAVTNEIGEREHMVGLAQAFFARGIPNYVGTGWKVNDAAAVQCAQTFYSYVLGLYGQKSPPATIGVALRQARRATRECDPNSTTWGAYQHYGSVADKLLPFPNARVAPTVGSANRVSLRKSAGRRRSSRP